MPRNTKGKHKAYMQEGIQKAEALMKAIDEIDPTYLAEAKAAGLDLEHMWQLYAGFCGDVERTAVALNLPPVTVLQTAERLGWQKKLEPILRIKESGRPGDVERALSRALNFVQAHRLRIVLQRLIDRFYSMNQDELFAACVSEKLDKEGNVVGSTVSTKPLTDLACALEKCHALLYMALGDTATERIKKLDVNGDKDGAVSSTELHTIISAAMAGPAPQLPVPVVPVS